MFMSCVALAVGLGPLCLQYLNFRCATELMNVYFKVLTGNLLS